MIVRTTIYCLIIVRIRALLYTMEGVIPSIFSYKFAEIMKRYLFCFCSLFLHLLQSIENIFDQTVFFFNKGFFATEIYLFKINYF